MISPEFKIVLTRAKNFAAMLTADHLFTDYNPIDAKFCRCTDPVSWKDALNLPYQPIKAGEKWGDKWDSAWFHLTARIPAEWAGKNIACRMNFGGEALVFDANGVPVYGLSDASVFLETHTFKQYYQLGSSFKGGEMVELRVEAAANWLWGIAYEQERRLKKEHPRGKFTGSVQRLEIGVYNLEVWQFILDFELVLNLAQALDEKDYRYKRCLTVLNDAMNTFAEDARNTGSARKVLQKILSLRAADSAMTAHAVGHAHIDTAWLWTTRETIRKAGRTFASQIHNIEQYPEYNFGASQAQLYAFVKDHYPELYRKIKKAVADGRWEIQGGMWVEADCNIPSGESFVRQFVHGKNFFMDEFGFDVKNLWIPDVFGYSAALPQIIKKSGCDYFLTQKMSWNTYNTFPYNNFMWRGLDGSEILTHFPPDNTYNCIIKPTEAIPAQNRNAEGGIVNDYMCLFGIGDGGGGPSEDYIERGRRMQSLEGCPRYKFSRADKFFEILSKSIPELPKWEGELYLEMHRGTFTTQSKTKRNNRKAEQFLTAVEFIASALPPSEYPAKELDKAWKLLLINQFHDIIPGSSIHEVYEQTEKEHASILALCEKLAGEAAAKLFETDQDSIVFINTLSYDYERVLELPDSWKGYGVTDASGKELPSQTEHGKVRVLATLPKSSFTTLKKSALNATSADVSKKELVLENEFVCYEFADNGALIRAFDKKKEREILKSGEAGNRLSLYIDTPSCYEAWDIDHYYKDQLFATPVCVKAEKTVSGRLRSALEFELKLGDSVIRQTIVLENNSSRLDFNTTVEWKEYQKMLRVAFPVNIFAREASFDVQYGFVRRSMTGNTSWDIAQFETCAHRYADISEADYGVALLNDCKYGHKVKESVIDLCLLRSSKAPDYDADLGTQIFTYSLLPHDGDLIHSTVMKEAACLNRPPLIADGFSSASSANPSISVESDSVTLEVVKKAEKEECTVIRLVETKGKHSQALIHLRNGKKELIGTNLIEWTEEEHLPVRDGHISISLKPFEIKTLKVR